MRLPDSWKPVPLGSEYLKALTEQQILAANHTPKENLIVIAGPGTGKTHMLTSRICSMIAKGVPKRSILTLSFTRQARETIQKRFAEYHPLTMSYDDDACTFMTFHGFAFDILRKASSLYPVCGYRAPFGDSHTRVSFVPDDHVHLYVANAILMYNRDEKGRQEVGGLPEYELADTSSSGGGGRHFAAASQADLFYGNAGVLFGQGTTSSKTKKKARPPPQDLRQDLPTDSENVRAMCKAIADFKCTAKPSAFPLKFFREKRKAKFMTLSPEERTIRMICEHFDTLLFEHRHFDLNGICIGLLCLLTDTKGPHELIGDALRNRYRILICDEFQDLNRTQICILKELVKTRTGVPDAYLTVVGDPNQSIFGFRGSMGAEAFCYLKRFFDHFDSTTRDLQLTKGWRCPKAVVVAVNSLIAQNYTGRNESGMVALDEPKRSEREGNIELKTWSSANAEFKGIAGAIRVIMERTGKVKYKDFAILARNNYSLQGFHQALNEEGIPCVGGSGVIYQHGSGATGGARRQQQQKEEEKKKKKKKKKKSDGDNVVTVSTIHHAKGSEWEYVFIVGCVEGQLPSGRATDPQEERRIMYVGMTRAKKALYLSWNSNSEDGLSRFVDETGSFE